MLNLLLEWVVRRGPLFLSTFSGLAFETLPFLAIGSLLSSLIHVLIPGKFLQRLFPTNKMASIMTGAFMGLMLPVCECGVVPVARSLKEKGLPLSTATAFLLAAPIVNPITIVSTIVAFQGAARPVFLCRAGLGVSAALLVALFVEMTATWWPLRTSELQSRVDPALNETANEARRSRPLQQLMHVLEHTSHDFLDTARFLIAGILVASFARALVPVDFPGARTIQSSPLAAAAGMAAAYLLSICSSADAFVARSLFLPLPFSATLGFLVLGPMLDLKNTILLSRFIPARRLACLVGLVFCVVFVLVTVSSSASGRSP